MNGCVGKISRAGTNDLGAGCKSLGSTNEASQVSSPGIRRIMMLL